MKQDNSKFKKEIDTSKAGKKLEKFEDPLVCNICGTNNIFFLDQQEEEIYCRECNSKRTLLDKLKIPEPTLVKTKKYWTKRFEEWKKGEDLTEKEIEELQETFYSTYYFDNSDKRTKLKEICRKMEVEICAN